MLSVLILGIFCILVGIPNGINEYINKSGDGLDLSVASAFHFTKGGQYPPL